MAVSQGKNWKKKIEVKLVQPMSFVEIGSRFMLEEDLEDGAIYEAVAKDPAVLPASYCEECGLLEICQTSNDSVPLCTKGQRPDRVGVWFKKI